MIRMLLLLALFVAGLYFGPVVAGQKGYVLIAMGDLTIEMTVVSSLIILLVAIGAFLVLESLARNLIGGERGNWLRGRRQRRAYRQMSDGMVALLEGEWKKAERLSARSSKHSPTPMLSYLVAAKAAQAQHKQAQRDDYLQLAHEDEENEPLALSLIRTQLLIEHGQNEEALARLKYLRGKHPKQPKLLKLQILAYRKAQSWAELLRCLEEARKRKLHNLDLEQLELEAHEGYMARLVEKQDAAELNRFWNQLSKTTRMNPRLFAHYCAALRQCDAATDMGHELVNRCRDQQSQLLLDELSQHQLKDAEQLWRQSKVWKLSDSALKESLLGLIALQAKQHQAAIEHLTRALEQQPSGRDYLALSRAYEALGSVQPALEASRNAVAFA